MSEDAPKQMMLELTVVFGNPTIPNHTLLVEHAVEDDMLVDMVALRDTAQAELGELLDEQCFYRLFTRDRPDD